MSLRLKLVLWYTGVLTVSGCLLTGTMYALVTHKMRSEVDHNLEEEFKEWRLITLELLHDRASLERRIRLDMSVARRFALTYRLRDTARDLDVLYLADEKLGRFGDELAAAVRMEAVPAKPVWARVWVGKRPRPFRVITGPLDPERHPGLVLQVARYTRLLHKREASVRKYLFVSLGMAVLLAALGGWFLASRSLKPIDDTVAELSGIQSRNLGERLQVGAVRDELDRLRAAINGMLERIEAAFGKLQGFTADAAHELRTPVTALQCRLEVALNKARSESDYQDALGDALEQASALGGLIENLLFLARMDAEDGPPATERVNLAELFAQLAEPFGILAEQKGVTLEIDCAKDCTIHGEPMLLRRLFGNLLDNAVRYTPSDGRVTVAAGGEDAQCLVTVANTGAGIEPEALGHVFDRFYRADPSRSREAGGTGLGLSIARRVIELHGGRIAVESTPGEGTTVHVWLPAVGSAPGDAVPPSPL